MDALTVIVLVAAVMYIVRRLKSSSQLPQPPGPKAHPFVGHLLQIPPGQVEEKFHEWTQIYGASPLLYAI
jgi:hypothetical protein